MRIFLASCAVALLTASATLADQPDALDLSTQVQRLRDQWIRCSAAAAKAWVRGTQPAEEIAGLALQRCRTQESALAQALRRQLGPDGAQRVLDLVRETDRLNLARAIEEIRAGR
jgi:hypothetical protein